MRAKIAIALAVVLGLQFGVEAPASASPFQTGNELARACDRTTAELLLCIGYVEAAVDVATGNGGMCITAPIEAGQAVQVVRNYFRANPQYLQYRATDLVQAALQQAFPCPK